MNIGFLRHGRKRNEYKGFVRVDGVKHACTAIPRKAGGFVIDSDWFAGELIPEGALYAGEVVSLMGVRYGLLAVPTDDDGYNLFRDTPRARISLEEGMNR